MEQAFATSKPALVVEVEEIFVFSSGIAAIVGIVRVGGHHFPSGKYRVVVDGEPVREIHIHGPWLTGSRNTRGSWPHCSLSCDASQVVGLDPRAGRMEIMSGSVWPDAQDSVGGEGLPAASDRVLPIPKIDT